MAKTKISEFSATPANNTDIDGINIAEGCAPSGINDAIRELMAQLKDWQSGTSNDPYVIGSSGSLTLNQGTANGVPYLNGSKVVTSGSVLTFDGAILGVNGVSVGRGAGAVATNTAVGSSALNANTTGATNTAVGNFALLNNTTANGNTALGYASVRDNTTGGNLTSVGYFALESNTTGGNNTAVGTEALTSNTTASNNTAVGYQAGYANTTGTEIAAFGHTALYSNTTGNYNSSFGRGSMYNNTTGSNNTAVGYQALVLNTTASSNTAVGYQALYSNTTVGFNTSLGYQSGYFLNGGSYNTFIGPYAGYYVTTGGKNTIIGNYGGNQGGLDIRTSSNNIVLSDGDGNPRQVIDSSGNYRSTGTGNSTLYPEFKCRAWVNFNGTGTVAIRASGNVTSITDNGTGDYTVNFTTAMPDANYSVSVTGSGNSAGAANNRIIGSQDGGGTSTASAVRVGTNTTTVAYDALYTNVSVFR